MNGVTYSGIAGPTRPGEKVNGSRCHWRDQAVDIDYGVVHFWVSPEDGPERYLRQLATPALPNSGVCYQSGFTDSHGVRRWLWQTPAGMQTTDKNTAAKWAGPRAATVLRAGYPLDPLRLAVGDPMPWCYGPGYPCVLGVDGDFHFAANPDDLACNHAPPFNERSIGAVMPGTYQTDDQWKDATSIAELLALAKLMVYSFHRWQVPIRYCDARALIAGIKGWTGHRDINEMQRLLGKKGVSNHGDPGANMPWDYVITLAHQILEGDDMARLCNIREIPADWPAHPCVVHPGFYVDHGGVLEPVSATQAAVRALQKSIKGDPNMADSVSAIDRNTLGSYRLHPGTTPHAPIAISEFLPAA